MAAGLATFPFTPPAAAAAASTSPAKSISSSFTPHLPTRLARGALRSTTTTTTTAVVVARYGGGGYRPRTSSGSRPRRNQRDNRVPDADYDPALDLDRLKSTSARVLDAQQNMIGIVPIDEAVRMAEDAELILAILSPDADPPVLRLFDSGDYKKHKYEQLKKKRDQQKRSSANRMDMKELKMGYNIDSHDYSVRMRAAQKFLKDGDKVKVMVNLKGRENEFRNIAIELLKRFQNDIGELAVEESKNFNDRNVFLILMPNKAILQKAQEQQKKKATPAVEISVNV